ncbi:hypothetical protein FUSNEC_GEN_280_10630 [Fusobacterium necrophorum subsp. funduliforme]
MRKLWRYVLEVRDMFLEADMRFILGFLFGVMYVSIILSLCLLGI